MQGRVAQRGRALELPARPSELHVAAGTRREALEDRRAVTGTGDSSNSPRNAPGYRSPRPTQTDSRERNAEPASIRGTLVDSHPPAEGAAALNRQDEVTRHLQAYQAGERGAFDRLVPIVYGELRAIAHRHLLRNRHGHSLNTTALVHEVYLKLVSGGPFASLGRAGFLALSARAMRQVVVDFARAQGALKRGGGARPVELQEGASAVEEEAERVLEVDLALGKLHAWNERMGRIVECRFFAGMTEQETAEALDVSRRTVQREWLRARAWLEEELAETA